MDSVARGSNTDGTLECPHCASRKSGELLPEGIGSSTRIVDLSSPFDWLTRSRVESRGLSCKDRGFSVVLELRTGLRAKERRERPARPRSCILKVSKHDVLRVSRRLTTSDDDCTSDMIHAQGYCVLEIRNARMKMILRRRAERVIAKWVLECGKRSARRVGLLKGLTHRFDCFTTVQTRRVECDSTVKHDG